MAECMVCLDMHYVCKTPCNHLICAGCLILLLDKFCPMCRRILVNIPKPVLEANKKLSSQKNLDVSDITEFPPLS